MKNNVIRGITTLFTIILTASLGRIQFGNHTETWYDLPMEKVVANAQQAGIPCEYFVREDGVKCYGEFVIVAADLKRYPRYTFVDTSLGMGIVLDSHTTDSETIDIATNWGKGGKE